MRKFYLCLIKIFLIFFLINSCSTTTDPADLIIRASSVAEISNVDLSSQNVTFHVKAWWSNSCGRLHHADIVKSDQSYDIKLFGFQKKEDICLTVISKYDAEVSINVQSPGKYTFKFWESDIATVDTTITIE